MVVSAGKRMSTGSSCWEALAKLPNLAYVVGDGTAVRKISQNTMQARPRDRSLLNPDQNLVPYWKNRKWMMIFKEARFQCQILLELAVYGGADKIWTRTKDSTTFSTIELACYKEGCYRVGLPGSASIVHTDGWGYSTTSWVAPTNGGPVCWR